MSDLQVKTALLDGFAPMFPATLTLLRKAQDATGCTNGSQLEKVAKEVPGFISMDRPKTSDGYTWFWGLTFERGDSKIAILLPWAQDFDAPDGNKNDRSPAVYLLKGKWNTDVGSIIPELREKMYALGAEKTA